LPPKPAIIRPVGDRLLTPGYLPMDRNARRFAIRELVARKVITREQAKHAMFLVLAVPSTPAPVVSFVDSAVDAVNRTEYTFALDFGDAAADRYLIATPSARGATSGTISFVTIGGVSATQIINTTALQQTLHNTAAIFIAAVPTGTSGDVVVTYADGKSRAGCGLFRVTGLSSATAHDTAADNVEHSPLVDTINVLGGGFVIAVAVGEATVIWAGVTESYDEAVEGGFRHSGGFDSELDAETGRTISATIASFPYILSAASFR
jgi:hypothetical protein